jgi:hypothetical protein
MTNEYDDRKNDLDGKRRDHDRRRKAVKRPPVATAGAV